MSYPGSRTPSGHQSPAVSDRHSPPHSQRKEHSSKEMVKKQAKTSPSQESTRKRRSLTCWTLSVPTVLRQTISEVAGPSRTAVTMQVKDPKLAGSEISSKGKLSIPSVVLPELLISTAVYGITFCLHSESSTILGTNICGFNGTANNTLLGTDALSTATISLAQRPPGLFSTRISSPWYRCYSSMLGTVPTYITI